MQQKSRTFTWNVYLEGATKKRAIAMKQQVGISKWGSMKKKPSGMKQSNGLLQGRMNQVEVFKALGPQRDFYIAALVLYDCYNRVCTSRP